MKRLFVFLLLISFHSVAVDAGLISSRSELDAQLGSYAITENFENWSGNVINFAGTLDNNTIVSGQGPGIVKPGLLFSGTSNRLQLDRRDIYQIPSGSLLAVGDLVITFANPITHFGLDLFQFSGFPDTATVRVFGTDGTTLLFTSDLLSAPNAPAFTFFGYKANSGIGRVTLSSSNRDWSPIIDDLTFGAVPEPSSFLLIVISGCVCSIRRNRR